MEIGEKLKIIRKKLDINQTDFSNELETSLKTYQNYENNKFPAKLEIICKLIEKFKINPSWLFINEGSIFINSSVENNTPEQYYKDAFNLTDYELQLIKDQFLSSSSVKKAILKFLQAKSKKQEALEEMGSILKDLQVSY